MVIVGKGVAEGGLVRSVVHFLLVDPAAIFLCIVPFWVRV
jgi:hypothetical protein